MILFNLENRFIIRLFTIGTSNKPHKSRNFFSYPQTQKDLDLTEP